MLRRYPHTAKLIVRTETDNGTGIPVVTVTETAIIGRWENEATTKTVDYSAKFYCPKLDLDPFSLDGQTLEFGGREFIIKHSSIQQTHSEIWLE